MEVWVTWCVKRAKCDFCGQYIESGQPIVKCREWRRHGSTVDSDGTIATRRWVRKLEYHFKEPQCWNTNAQLWLDQHPYKNTTKRGRAPLALEPDSKKMRNTILMRRANLTVRLREAIDNQDFEKVAHLVKKIEDCTEAIMPHGGPPKKLGGE